MYLLPIKNQRFILMTKIRLILLLLLFEALTSCNSQKDQFPVDKRYWEISDYDNAIRKLNYGYESDEKLPTFDDPETRIIVEKLTDQENFNIVLDDDELGLKHRNEVAKEFFSEWKEMSDIYNALDRKDQYIYDKEMIAVWHFGLALQLKYFRLGNDQIKETAYDPSSSTVKRNINSNVKTLISNYLIYLDEVNNENAYSDKGKVKLAEGIDWYFSELVNLYPNANYSDMKTKAKLILKKSESEEIKSALNQLINLIKSK